jgi:hypothetical protein
MVHSRQVDGSRTPPNYPLALLAPLLQNASNFLARNSGRGLDYLGAAVAPHDTGTARTSGIWVVGSSYGLVFAASAVTNPVVAARG